jgi:hypothetical protein
METSSASANATPHATQVRAELLIAHHAVERACAILGAGGGILDDRDRADGITQLRAAQDLIQGMGLRVRRECGL